MLGSPLLFLLQEEGNFIREVLIDEVAKGVDAAWRLGLDNAIKQSNQSILSAALQQVPTLSEEQDREQVACAIPVVPVSISHVSFAMS